MAHLKLVLLQPPLNLSKEEQMKSPTPTQQKMIDIIINYIEETGSSPTLRYLQVEMGYRSTNAVRDMLNRLVRKGHLLESTPDHRRISLSNRYRTIVLRQDGKKGV